MRGYTNSITSYRCLHDKEDIITMATIRKLKSGNYQAIITVDGRKISAAGKT